MECSPAVHCLDCDAPLSQRALLDARARAPPSSTGCSEGDASRRVGQLWTGLGNMATLTKISSASDRGAQLKIAVGVEAAGEHNHRTDCIHHPQTDATYDHQLCRSPDRWAMKAPRATRARRCAAVIINKRVRAFRARASQRLGRLHDLFRAHRIGFGVSPAL